MPKLWHRPARNLILVDRTVPNVTFTRGPIDPTPPAPAGGLIESPFEGDSRQGDLGDGGRTIADALAGGVALLDVDRDGDLDLFTIGAGHVQLHRNDRGAWVDITREWGLDRALPSGGMTCVAGDYDNDGARICSSSGMAAPSCSTTKAHAFPTRLRAAGCRGIRFSPCRRHSWISTTTGTWTS